MSLTTPVCDSRLCLAVLFFSVCVQLNVLAQSREEDGAQKKTANGEKISFEEVQAGQRIAILLKNEHQFKGSVAEKNEEGIVLDISEEQVEITGTITIQRKSIRDLWKLEERSRRERLQMRQKKKKFRREVWKQRKKKYTPSPQEQEQAKKEKTGNKQSVEEKEQGKQEKQKKPSEEEANKQKLEEYKNLRQEFPVDSWSQKRYEEVKSKYEFQRTPKERRFLENWDKLQNAREAKADQQQKKLLEKFPPKETVEGEGGWDHERYLKIKHKQSPKRPVLTEKERTFLENYEEWKKAYDEWKKEKNAEQAEASGGPEKIEEEQKTKDKKSSSESSEDDE